MPKHSIVEVSVVFQRYNTAKVVPSFM